MRNKVRLLDTVALTVDLPEHDLWRGQVGTVVEFLAHGHAFEVEFSDNRGYTYKSQGLCPEQIMILHYEPSEVYALTRHDIKSSEKNLTSHSSGHGYRRAAEFGVMCLKTSDRKQGFS